MKRVEYSDLPKGQRWLAYFLLAVMVISIIKCSAKPKEDYENKPLDKIMARSLCSIKYKQLAKFEVKVNHGSDSYSAIDYGDHFKVSMSGQISNSFGVFGRISAICKVDKKTKSVISIELDK